MRCGLTSWRRRARAALGWTAGLFLLVQFLGGLVLDHLWTAVRFPTLARQLAYLEARPCPPDILCLGSSRFGLGLHAPEIRRVLVEELPSERPPEVFNASVEAGDLISADFILRQLLSRGVRPCLAVVEISPDVLHRRNPWMYYHVRRQLRWRDIPAFFVDIVRARQDRRLLMARLLPLYVHRVRIAQELGEHGLPGLAADPYGFDGSDLSWHQVLGIRDVQQVHRRDWTEIGVAGTRRALRDYRIGGRSAAALKSVLAQCQQHDIAVILVGVPVTQAHRDLYTPTIEAAFQAHLRHITQTYGCRFVDCRAAVPDQLFWDNHHMLPAGCQFFSRKLAREVLAPAWRQVRTQYR